MHRSAARELLGVARDAPAAAVMAAYGRRSRRLKHALLEAATVGARDRLQRALRNLIVLRDLALDTAEADALYRRRAERRPVLVDDWWTPAHGIPALPDRAGARDWLGVGPRASAAAIREVSQARSRQLKMRIARATTEQELHLLQHALADLRRAVASALAPPSGALLRIRRQGDLSAPLESEDTLSDHPRAP
jgi:hypothetical protein